MPVPRRVEEEPLAGGRTLRLSDVTGPVSGLRGGQPRPGRFSPSTERSLADRERRHRERAIAAWLRDLSR